MFCSFLNPRQIIAALLWFSFISLYLSPFQTICGAQAAALPVQLRQAAIQPSKFLNGRNLVDPGPDYSDYQISDGVGGTAQEEAEAIFFAPFEGLDLATVPFEVYDALHLAEEIASDAEIELFQPAMRDATSEWEREALRVGMYKNKILYQAAAVQASKIKVAKHEAAGIVDPWQSEDLAVSESIYYYLVDVDSQNAGRPSLGVV